MSVSSDPSDEAEVTALLAWAGTACPISDAARHSTTAATARRWAPPTCRPRFIIRDPRQPPAYRSAPASAKCAQRRMSVGPGARTVVGFAGFEVAAHELLGVGVAGADECRARRLVARAQALSTRTHRGGADS